MYEIQPILKPEERRHRLNVWYRSREYKMLCYYIETLRRQLNEQNYMGNLRVEEHNDKNIL